MKKYILSVLLLCLAQPAMAIEITTKGAGVNASMQKIVQLKADTDFAEILAEIIALEAAIATQQDTIDSIDACNDNIQFYNPKTGNCKAIVFKAEQLIDVTYYSELKGSGDLPIKYSKWQFCAEAGNETSNWFGVQDTSVSRNYSTGYWKYSSGGGVANMSITCMRINPPS